MNPITPLESDTVRVRWIEVDAEGDLRIPGWRELLDDKERARASRFRRVLDHNVFIAAHALLRSMLSEATGRPARGWRYAVGRHGKPRLADDCRDSGLHFNLTHTRGIAVCAIASNDVGVDIEVSDRRVDLAVADRFFAPPEILAIRTAPPERRAELFFRYWTLKEAFIKATGEGLSRNLASFSFTLDPVRIAFHPNAGSTQHNDNPCDWQFVERSPTGDSLLAVAVRRSAENPVGFDIRAASGFCD